MHIVLFSHFLLQWEVTMCRDLIACFTSELTECPGQVKSTRNGKQMKIPLEYNWSNLFPVTWSICEWMSLCNKRTLSIFKCLIYNLLVGNEAHFLKMSIFYICFISRFLVNIIDLLFWLWRQWIEKRLLLWCSAHLCECE